VEDGLWELAAAGLVTADGFENLRALIEPKRRRGEGRGRHIRPRHAAGRWALLEFPPRQAPQRTEAFACQLLDRWGVVFRDLLGRETLAPGWRDLLVALRRMEARGEIRGGRFVGGFLGEQFARPEAIDLMVFANGLLGRGEKIGLIFAAANDPDEYLGGGLYVDAPVNSRGTRGNALLFRSNSAPNEAPVNLDDHYTRQRVTSGVSHPLRQDSKLSLLATGAFEADDLTIDRNGTSIREDRLRIVDAGLRASWNGGAATQYSANLRMRKGLDAFGAGLQSTDLLDDPRRADFLVALLQGTAYRRFAEHWSARVDAFSQFTNHVLPDTERFKIGGDRLGRGFEVAEIAGDRGVGAKLELRRYVTNTESFFGRVSAYGFYDFGAAWKRDLPGRESAATAGTGVAIAGGALTGYLELAAPLTGADIEGKRKASVFAELSYRF
jgi:hemolysin activation/secretion protein